MSIKVLFTGKLPAYVVHQQIVGVRGEVKYPKPEYKTCVVAGFV